jgi:hypothetical protein
MKRLSLIFFTALLLSACGGSNSQQNTPAIDGTWKAVESIVGNSLTLTLTSQNSAVSGTGKYVGEAGPSGTLTVTGNYIYPQVTLTLTFDNGGVETYTGSMSSANEMDGTLASTSGYSASQSFTR